MTPDSSNRWKEAMVVLQVWAIVVGVGLGSWVFTLLAT